jgi:ATP-dependent Clp protease protease subunit
MGAFLLGAGRKGRRSALPHSRIMIHQPSQQGGGGSASDIEIQAKEILYLRGKLNQLWTKHTGQSLERIERDTDRDRYLSAEEAKDYGIVDHVITQRGEVVEPSTLAAVTK